RIGCTVAAVEAWRSGRNKPIGAFRQALHSAFAIDPQWWDQPEPRQPAPRGPRLRVPEGVTISQHPQGGWVVRLETESGPITYRSVLPDYAGAVRGAAKLRAANPIVPEDEPTFKQDLSKRFAPKYRQEFGFGRYQ